MREKQLLSEKIESISNSLAVSKKDIKLIVNSFLVYKQLEVLYGREVKISDIVEIIPDPIRDNTITTLAYVAKEISIIHSIPYNTVKTIIDYYIEIQIEQLKAGKPIDFRGLVKIHPNLENSKIKSVHSSISTVITNSIIEEKKLRGARVHTSKSLKMMLYNRVISEESIQFEDDIEQLEDDKIAVNWG